MRELFVIPSKSTGVTSVLLSWQNLSGNYLAVCNGTNTVTIYDRHGENVTDVKTTGVCTWMCWDRDGDNLALLNDKTSSVLLWDANTRKSTTIETGVGSSFEAGVEKTRDILTFACWSRKNKLLAIGNNKGNLLIYNHRTLKKIPIMAKHSGKITCGSYSEKDLLALGADDRQISVSSAEGENSQTFACSDKPQDIKFSEGGAGQVTISAIVGRKNLMLINMHDSQRPTINLQFQARYGLIVQYSWYGDGYILIGFEHGFLVSISTVVSEIGEEIFSVQDHKTSLSSLVISTSLGKAITAGDSSVVCRELHQLRDVFSKISIEGEVRNLGPLQITEDGQLLALGTSGGRVHVFLTQLPVLGDVCGLKIVRLTSLTEITIGQISGQSAKQPIVFNAEIEPNLIGVGPGHVVACTNNKAWFYAITNPGIELIAEREYMGSVQMIKMNGRFAAALYEGKVQLHQIDTPPSTEEERVKSFPDSDKATSKISCIGFFDDFLILASDTGHLQYFYVEDWKYVNEYKHTNGVKLIFPEPYGTKLIFIDSKMDVFLYNPSNDHLIEIPDSRSSVKGIFWDNYYPDRDVFLTYDSSNLYTYIFYRDTIEGPKIIYVGASKLSDDYVPLCLFGGQVHCLTSAAKPIVVELSKHAFDSIGAIGKNPSDLEKKFRRLITLKKWHLAWEHCEATNSKKYWQTLGNAALEHMDLDFAVRLFRRIGDVSMVWSLEEIFECEERNLLAAHLAMYLEKFDLAEKLYLESSEPLNALEMRRDLLQWEKALSLANRLSPNEIPFISKEYAQQLEFMGDYANSLVHYEKGLLSTASLGLNENSVTLHNENCQAGIARNCLRLSDIRRGLKFALELSQKPQKKECAQILESLKQFNEAAQIYENGQFYEKAAMAYAKGKNWLKVGELLAKVNSPRIHIQYAKAMEADKKYKLAIEAYKTAKDYDNIVRVQLDYLNNPEEAVRVVQESKSIEGAKLVAKFFLKMNDYNSAVQFLVLSQCHGEAFKISDEHDKMDIYASVIGTEAGIDHYLAVAKYFEKRQKACLAGKFYYLGGQYSKALDFLISNGDDDEAIKLAVECIGKAKNDQLTEKLMKFLLGESDGVPKDARHLFKLYLALESFSEAAKTAVIIAREEQNNGQYRVAHDLLLGMYEDLKNRQIFIPSEVENSLMLLHCYLLIKSLIKKGDDVQAARLLIKVASNISKFPSHAVQILTSAVIQCSKANMKSSAFTYAAMLMRAEYRKKIDEKYRKKIEGIVRKPEKTEEQESQSPCPYCNVDLADSELTCGTCKNNVPYCIITGKHILKDDLTVCPKCRFPARFEAFKKFVESGDNCPMCSAKIQSIDLQQIFEMEKVLSLSTHSKIA